MRLRQGRPRHVAGWVGGLIEEAEPDRADAEGQADGVLDVGENFVATETGRLLVRGGSLTKRTPTNASSVALSQMLGIFPFTQTGAVSIGHHVGSAKHFLHRLDSALAYTTGLESTSRHDLGWNTATAGKPVVAEFYEKLLIADATLAYASRRPLLSVDGSGTVTTIQQDLDGNGPANLYPFCVAVFAGFVFIAGFDNNSDGDRPETIRHSKVGEDPAAPGGFEALAWARIGAVGQRISAMSPGDNLLLVAKHNELYRINDGPTLYGGVGFQFAIQQLDNSRGFGVSNPYALYYRKPFWYGLGDAGPFRTDGSSLDSLVGVRRRTWRKVQGLDKAWVTFHPERNAILFGVPVTDDPANPTYPSRVMVWDVARENWMPDWPLGRSVIHCHAISTPIGATTTLDSGAPTAPPGAPSQTFDSNVPTPTGSSFRMTFTPGDVTSQTEIWIRTAGSGSVSVLYATIAAGVSTFDVTGRDVSTLYLVKLRHRKGAAFSDFSAEGGAQTGATELAAPSNLEQTFTDGVTPTNTNLDFTFTAGAAGADTEVWKSNDNVTFTLDQTIGAGTTAGTITGGSNGANRYVKVRAKQGSVYSVFTAAVRMFFADSTVITAPSALAQTVNGSTPTTGSVTMTYTPGNATGLSLVEVWRRLPAGVSALVAVLPSSGSFSISQDASTDYRYKLRHRVGGAFSGFTGEVAAYTKLVGPTIVGKAPYSQTEIQLTIDNNDDGADVRVYDANSLAILETLSTQAAGEVIAIPAGLTCGTTYDLRASAVRSGWPVGLREEFSSTVSESTQSC